MSTGISWFILIIAGLFESIWAIGLEYSDGLSNLKPTIITVVALIISVLLLAKSLEKLPVGTAYAVWTGIGASTTAILGIYMFDDPATLDRLLFITIIIIGIAGLQIVSSG